MATKRSYWLIKSEPTTFPWNKFVKEGTAVWDGVRNYEARNNLRAMKVGDLALFYHSSEGREILGVARVTREAYQDPTTKEDWSAVDFAPVASIVKPVSLAQVRAAKPLANMGLIKRPRISVTPVTREEFDAVLTLGATTLPR